MACARGNWTASRGNCVSPDNPAASASRSINPVSAQLSASCAKAVSAPLALPQLQPGDHYSLFMTGTAAAPVLRGQASATDTYRP